MKQTINSITPEANVRNSINGEKDSANTILGVDSPVRLFLVVTITLFFVEFFLMAVLFRHSFQTNLLEILLDPTLMVVIAFPVLYRFFLLPMRRILEQKTRAEKSLANMNEVLEHRVQKRTQELGVLNAQLQAEILENRLLQEGLETRVGQRTSELTGEIQERLQVERELEETNKILRASSVSEREQRQIAEGLMEAAIALNSSQNVEEVLDRILDETQRAISSTIVSLILVEQDRLVHAGWRGLDLRMEDLSSEDIGFKLKDFPVLDLLTMTKTAVLVADTSMEPNWRPIEGVEWIRSFASAPLELNGNVIGYLQIIGEFPDQFTLRSLQILNGFAAHAGLAIQNARLIENLQQSLAKEREIREELIRAEKLATMGRTIASVAHELNNPIQTIKNCTYLMRTALKGTDREESSQEMLDLISIETQRISGLVSQLREFFRPSLSLTMTRVDIKDMILEVNNLLKPHMRAARVVSKIEQNHTSMIIYGVPDQVHQVFINLFQNAIDAMQNGGRLEVKFSFSEDRSRLEIAVADTGPGISEDTQSKIFEPFFSTKPKGMGLGLPIVNQIIQRHNGTIRVESAPGQGTSFFISLPLCLETIREN